MGRVGLDLYLEMLEEAVARLKGTPVTQDVETELNLGLPAHIPQSYIEDGRERLRCYKALTSATSGAAARKWPFPCVTVSAASRRNWSTSSPCSTSSSS